MPRTYEPHNPALNVTQFVNFQNRLLIWIRLGSLKFQKFWSFPAISGLYLSVVTVHRNLGSIFRNCVEHSSSAMSYKAVAQSVNQCTRQAEVLRRNFVLTHIVITDNCSGANSTEFNYGIRKTWQSTSCRNDATSWSQNERYSVNPIQKITRDGIVLIFSENIHAGLFVSRQQNWCLRIKYSLSVSHEGKVKQSRYTPWRCLVGEEI
jgi:hypothetical protein